MKKILFSICFMFMLSVTGANAEYATITPQQLTAENTSKYEAVNFMSNKLFQNIPTNMRFKLGFLPTTYENQPLINDNVFNNDNTYNCVQYKQAQLDYNKDTGKLEKIRINKNDLLPARLNYDYPSGKLSSVEIYDYDAAKNIATLYVFDSKGNYIDLYDYSYSVQKQLRQLLEGKFPFKYYSRTNKFVKIIVTIDNTGRISRAEIIEPSANSEADEAVLKAILSCELVNSFPENIPLDKLHYAMSFPTFKSKI